MPPDLVTMQETIITELVNIIQLQIRGAKTTQQGLKSILEMAESIDANSVAHMLREMISCNHRSLLALEAIISQITHILSPGDQIDPARHQH